MIIVINKGKYLNVMFVSVDIFLNLYIYFYFQIIMLDIVYLYSKFCYNIIVIQE